MSTISSIIQEVKKAVKGKDQVLIWMLMAILAGGNILLEDIPGVGKTTIALAFSRAMGLDYGRVQFNPDVLPSDITGYTVLEKHSGNMVFKPGAVMCNLFLADELNRATSRTQSALLEAMEEGQVTVDGVSHTLPKPFFVLATQNPTGAAGTQLLPDSQMDRFMIRLSVGYPKPLDEREMLRSRLGGIEPLQTVRQVISRGDLLAMQQTVAAVYMKDEIIDYIVALVGKTRAHPQIRRGASPRATIAVSAMARAAAVINGRDYVLPEDVQTVYAGTVAHRIVRTAETAAQEVPETAILAALLSQVPAPGY